MLTYGKQSKLDGRVQFLTWTPKILFPRGGREAARICRYQKEIGETMLIQILSRDPKDEILKVFHLLDDAGPGTIEYGDIIEDDEAKDSQL